ENAARRKHCKSAERKFHHNFDNLAYGEKSISVPRWRATRKKLEKIDPDVRLTSSARVAASRLTVHRGQRNQGRIVGGLCCRENVCLIDGTGGFDPHLHLSPYRSHRWE